MAVKSYQRTPRQPGIREELLSGIPKVIEEYVIPEEETCSVCGAPLKIIGKQIVHTEVEFIPAKVRVVQVVRQVAKCTECGIKEGSNEKEHFQKAAVPAKVLPPSIATHSLVSWVMYQKFAMGIPLHWQENDFFRMGLILPRADMIHWVIRCSEEWLTPVYDRIHQALLSCGVLHIDTIKEKEDYTIFIAAQDEVSSNFTGIMQNSLKTLGLKTELSGKYRYSYYAVIDQGKVQEDIGLKNWKLMEF